MEWPILFILTSSLILITFIYDFYSYVLIVTNNSFFQAGIGFCYLGQLVAGTLWTGTLSV